MSKSQKKKVRQAKTVNGKLTPEEAQHLRRCGLTISNQIKSPSKRSLRRFTNWWETTPVEKFLEDIDFLLQKSAFLTILGSLSNLAILVALITFIGGEKVRRNHEVFTAWQTITNAEGQSGSGGRIEALEFLNSHPLRFPWIGWTKKDWFWDKDEQECQLKRLLGLRWKRQPLVGLSAPNQAYLKDIHLCGARLWGADFQESDLWDAELQGADLQSANLQKARLWFANLQKADLKLANLQGADLQGANLISANLEDANLVNVRNLTSSQIKSTCHWDKATYEQDKEENKKYIEKLKKHKSSAPQEKPDCTIWE